MIWLVTGQVLATNPAHAWEAVTWQLPAARCS